MTTGRLIASGAMLAVLLVLWGCSSDKESGGDSRSLDDDRREIAATVAETAIRWHYGDKTILYEQEFEYAQVEHTYDSYLQLPRIKKMEADTVHAFVVKDVKFFNRDSALVSVDVVFVGPTMDTTHFPQQWTMYYHRGRWIRPSMSGPNTQREFEERRRKADSAAAAEEKEEW